MSYISPSRGIADAFVDLLRSPCFWPGRGEGLVKVPTAIARRTFLPKLHRFLIRGMHGFSGDDLDPAGRFILSWLVQGEA